MLVTVTWLSTLVALIEKVSVRRVSAKRKERFKLEFNVMRKSPGIVVRPASPNCPATGVVNASVLKYGSPDRRIGWPVASARRFPPTARPPVLARLPDTYAVNGEPVVALKAPFMFQLRRIRLFQPLRNSPRTPTG